VKQAKPSVRSKGEEAFAFHVTAYELPAPIREYRFCPTRRFRFDFAWPDQKIYVEVEGGLWNGGRHTRAAGYEADLTKYNLAALMGWRGLRFSTEMVISGEAIQQTQAFLAGKPYNFQRPFA
jgi:very-short-patch-repair endonuclease